MKNPLDKNTKMFYPRDFFCLTFTEEEAFLRQKNSALMARVEFCFEEPFE